MDLHAAIQSGGIAGFEAITAMWAAGSKLMLGTQDVLDMSDSNRLYLQGSGYEVNLTDTSLLDTHTTQTINGVTYGVYTGSMGGSTATLFVDTHLTVHLAV